MILQPCTSLHPNPSLSSPSRPLPCRRNPRFTLTARPPPRIRIACSISQARGYGGTVDSEKGPPVTWLPVYKKISLMAQQNPNLGSATILTQWEVQNKPLTKFEVSRIVKELRRYNFHKQALEVYGWVSNHEERFGFSPSDAAIYLDLIAKVCGIPSAESYYHRLPEKLKDRRIYGALLNSYVRDKKREQAESLFEEMRVKGYAMHPLPFNVMMTLYMKLKDYAKVESLVSEMMDKNMKPDSYSYNIWISCCGYQGSAEKMEQAFEQMKQDKTIYLNWTTFSTLATMYVKFGQLEKAEECARKLEGRIKRWEQIPYLYLLTLYGSIGKKDQVFRVWYTYKSAFPAKVNLGYRPLINALIKLGDVGEAEKIYEEWLAGKTYYDARIANLFMAAYIKEGNLEKAENFFKHMVQEGGNPISSTWEILAELRIGQKKIPEALICFKEAFSGGGSKRWRLKPANVSAFSNLCDKAGDAESKEVLLKLLEQSGHLEDEEYASKLSSSTTDTEKDGTEYDDSETILNQTEIAG